MTILKNHLAPFGSFLLYKKNTFIIIFTDINADQFAMSNEWDEKFCVPFHESSYSLDGNAIEDQTSKDQIESLLTSGADVEDQTRNVTTSNASDIFKDVAPEKFDFTKSEVVSREFS